MKAENVKYQQIMEAAIRLFTRFGIKRVSVEEICSTARVSKATFYKYFKNKIELVKQILIDFSNTVLEYKDKVMQEEIPFKNKIKKIIEYKIEMVKEYGDLFMQEILINNPELKAFIMNMKKDSINKIMQLFKVGQQEGAIPAEMKPEFYIYLLEKVSEMIMEDQHLKMIYPEIKDRVEKISDFFYYGIYSRKEE